MSVSDLEIIMQYLFCQVDTHETDDWTITLVDTGENTLKGGG